MRFIKLTLLGIILVAIVLLALANREVVTVQALPSPLAQIMPLSVEMPLFLFGLIAIVVGLVLGYILEWLREHRHRRRAAEKAREAERLSREVDRLKKANRPEDDVLALIS
jgi:lipopolysaccharide assembly protein A